MEDYYEFNKKKSQKSPWWTKVSVEPVMFLYMGSFMISSVVEQAFFIHKACMVDVGLTADICANISAKENEEYNKRVQVVVSTFHQYEGIVSHVVPVVLAFYLGAWSDRVGRKLTLLLGLCGSLFYWVALIVNSLQDSWPLQIVLYTATFPSSLTGNSLAVFMSTISYLCDITSPEERTVRMTLLETAYLITMPLGIAVGSYLFKNVMRQSFTLMFTVSGVMMACSVLWALLRLEWCTNNTKQAAPISYLRTVRDTVRVITKSRPNSYALYLRLIVFALAVYTFQRDEKNMTYLYTILKFNWNVQTYSTFRTFQSSLYILGLLLGGPILGKLLGLQDTVIVMVGAISHCIARVIYATASQPAIFYIGGAAGALGPIAAPVMRSMTSKLVPASERGKAFSLLSVADTSVPILSGAIYTQVYNATIDFAPASVFWVTVFTQVLVFGCALTIYCIRGPRSLEQAVDPQNETQTDVVSEILE